MSKGRDPLGKRALFSGASEDAPSQARPPRPLGPLDVRVTCAACDRTSVVSVPEIALKHLPVVAWLPWRKRSLLMRCPACNAMAWHAVQR